MSLFLHVSHRAEGCGLGGEGIGEASEGGVTATLFISLMHHLQDV